jgi:hypothetical protein
LDSVSCLLGNSINCSSGPSHTRNYLYQYSTPPLHLSLQIPQPSHYLPCPMQHIEQAPMTPKKMFISLQISALRLLPPGLSDGRNPPTLLSKMGSKMEASGGLVSRALHIRYLDYFRLIDGSLPLRSRH